MRTLALALLLAGLFACSGCIGGSASANNNQQRADVVFGRAF